MRKGWLALLPVGGLVGGLFVVAPMMMVGVTGAASETASSSTCEATSTTQQGSGQGLKADQWSNAEAIVKVGLRLKVGGPEDDPNRGLVVAISTAFQESGLRNLPGGDRDSVGLFQQRDAWGSFAQRTDPEQAAEMFFKGGHAGQRGLLNIPGWQQMAVTAAAQAVQVSAFPFAYAKWETQARSVVSAIGGKAVPKEDCKPAEDPAGGPCPVVKGNYGNGQLPDSALCPLPFDHRHRLRGDATNAIARLNVAYKAEFGADLCVTDSYRSLAAQYDVYRRKPGLAAKPGTSNHGWGLALDLCGGIQTAGSAESEWMNAHEGDYGWTLPQWAQPSGSKPENWHRECVACGAK